MLYSMPRPRRDNPDDPADFRFPTWLVRNLFFIRIGKGDAEQVQETLDWGADPNWTTKRGTPAIVRAVRGMLIESKVVETLLKAGADHTAADAQGLTALDHARRRLLKYEGRPRKPPRRSPSLTPHGDVRLHPEEHKFIEEMTAEYPEFEMDYLEARRKAAERVFDPRGNLERIVEILERADHGRSRRPS